MHGVDAYGLPLNESLMPKAIRLCEGGEVSQIA
jgi:hypothetical protein